MDWVVLIGVFMMVWGLLYLMYLLGVSQGRAGERQRASGRSEVASGYAKSATAYNPPTCTCPPDWAEHVKRMNSEFFHYLGSRFSGYPPCQLSPEEERNSGAASSASTDGQLTRR